ncbi:GNAT family protein [Nocardioides sp.]|uniref:GNAT family N-acetyltransferase n=1 Tax=Nocardioides sp. TaxID=35761 RepID=UPI00262026D7|nr:GNAT family protein [Nocardioides sp.]
MSDELAAISWPISTERLTLRRVRVGDAALVWPWRRLPESYAWVTHAATSREAFAERFESPEGLRSRLVIDLEGRIVGDLMVRIGDAWGQTEVRDRAARTEAELGWSLDPAYGGRGIATEAVAAVIDRCFTDLGLRRVTAACFAANEPSWRLMERLGMRREQHGVRDSLHRSGDWMDGLTYALLASEWPVSQP